MARRGRPPLTEDVVLERIAAYCAQYGVTERNESGFPVYPAGNRETPQHREWVVLFKAWSRARQRAAIAAGEAKAGRCPICFVALGPSRTADVVGRGAATMHPRCRQFVEIAEELGSAALDRTKSYLATSHQTPSRPRKVD